MSRNIRYFRVNIKLGNVILYKIKVLYIEYQLRNRTGTGVKVTDDKTSELFSPMSLSPYFLASTLNLGTKLP